MKKTVSTNLCLLALLSLSARADDAKTKSKAKPDYQTYHEMTTVALDKEVTELPPLPDAAERKKNFDHRNDPDRIEALAKEFFSLWDPSEKRASRERVTKDLEPAKAKVYALYKQGKYQESLDAFRAYFFAKMRMIFKDDKGLTSSRYLRRGNGYDSTVTLLMQGVYQVGTTKQTVRLGEPGLTHWEFQRSGPLLWDNAFTPEIPYFNNGSFSNLWWKFVDTQDHKYLDRYLAYADDFVLNEHFHDHLNIGNIDAGKFGLNEAFSTCFNISEIARWLPPSGEGYSSATLARQLVYLLKLKIPLAVYYNREQSNNHSTGAVHNQLALSNYLYDFKFAKVMERESRRQFETYGTLFDMPNGAMPGKNEGYAVHELRENLIAIDRMRDYDYDWVTPQWNRIWTDRLMRRAFYVLNLYNPSGEIIQLYKGDWRNRPFDTFQVYQLNRELPRLWDIPAARAIATRIIHNQLIPNENGKSLISPTKPIASEGMGVRDGAEPPYTSISFPVTGTHIMRNGWDPQKDAFGIFSESRGKGDNGGAFHNVKCTNLLEIGAFGKDLLTNGVDAVYNYVPSPVLVDGLSQFSLENKGPGARKGDNNEGLLPLSQYRIHHSEAFDMAEGCYEGMWADTMDHEPQFYDWKYQKEVLKKAVKGIMHRRIVQFVKEEGVWVVIDLLHAPGKHEYTQQFFMPSTLKGELNGYKPEAFSLDEKALTLKSGSPDKPNLILHYAGPGAESLKIAKAEMKEEPRDTYTFERADRKRDKEFVHLKSSWEGTDTTLLITVLEGSEPKGKNGGNAPISEFKRTENGFSAKLASGGNLQFQAHLTKENPEGFESKLTLTDAKGNKKGLVLGKKSYEFAGKKGAEVAPVYRPIQDLVITPERHAFIDTLDVAVSCPNKDVEIRYSIDGSDPTLDSPVYKNPVTLTGSALFKARAFRKGLKAMPADLASGTLMSRVFFAPFTREEPLPALALDAAKTEPGLKYDYYQAQWPFLLYGAPSLKPVKSGVAKGVFDLNAVQDNKQAFGFFYTGYINVPEDGVYTFYAPDEFMKYRPLAGYDLDVYVGNNPVYKDGTLTQGNTPTEWYPTTSRHAFGTWSKALKKGLHPFKVYYADLRPGGHLEYIQYSYPELNIPGLTKTFFDGKAPVLDVSGPGVSRQAIPVSWFRN